MNKTFKAYRIHEIDQKIGGRFEQLTLDDLAPGEVVVRVLYSDINYKDALAATGAGRILRKYPLVGGIDLAGVVESSTDARCKPGDHVLVTGCGLSETHDGGYAEYARLKGEWVIPLPPGFGAFKAMSLGTAGFTAALAIHRMEHNGQTPAKGPIVVTGATGGVGSIAIDMLAGRGYEVIAVSGKAESIDYLQSLGAARVLLRKEIDYGKRPLEAARFAGAIDNVGGETLTWLTRTVDNWGNIASIGLAGGAELHTTVMPFILRGVNLLGINSSATLREMRLVVWNRIATDLKPRHLERIATRTIAFDELPGSFDAYLQGTVTGRTVVKIGS
ncbi:MAG: oxidoreductase [Gammaproteobacteria bacterium]|jgi:acrylyl-CoA reductase (NADPH)|nr:oxidoreductase [Gammaproteobacteria bacterium]MBM4209599.1 oxidoreductase [Gammaproteobacteria bacterium]MBM4223763.1 oxidoreductase [Gammaproteobacteria bacterium]MBM4230609.1 oxidoreductase [Gammaproteobacteria bacterium]